MTIATINRFITLFHDAFADLRCDVSMAQTERLAVAVHHAMESKSRAYHGSAHVFGMCREMLPRQVLAGLFHDVVYYQLDGGFPKHLAGLLSDIGHGDGGTLVLQDIGPPQGPTALCAAIFGFQAGQTLPLYGGMNEFLSAVVAARLLQPLLPMQDLIAVVACIEATIPFRAPQADGSTAASVLLQRVQEQARAHLAAWTPDAIAAYAHGVVSDAIAIANRDVSGFGQDHPALFLSSTWLLMEESNAPLTALGGYSVQDYRGALMRMDTFLSNLNPSHVFQGFGEVLPPPELAAWNQHAQRNIRFAVDYLDAKLVSIAIIEALALYTGSDGPISMFLGDIRSADGKPDQIEDWLPTAPTGQTVDEELLRVFEKGRALVSSNDLTASPLTAFVYRFMGHEGSKTALTLAKAMFEGRSTPLAFLQGLERDMVLAISRACAQIALSRRDALLALEQAL